MTLSVGKEGVTMREIKFRGWNTQTKTMIDLYKITPLAVSGNLQENTDGLYIPFSPMVVLMQYTGLKDKNDKEIYDGDIIRHDYRDTLTVIEWRDKDASWSMGGYQPENTEVIGNIYQNKELLS